MALASGDPKDRRDRFVSRRSQNGTDRVERPSRVLEVPDDEIDAGTGGDARHPGRGELEHHCAECPPASREQPADATPGSTICTSWPHRFAPSTHPAAVDHVGPEPNMRGVPPTNRAAPPEVGPSSSPVGSNRAGNTRPLAVTSSQLFISTAIDMLT